MATLLIAIFILSIYANLPTFAATEDEIEESIEKGLVWLAGQQNEDGSWGIVTWDYVRHTGLAVLKFIDRAKELGKDPFDEGYEYNTQVDKGLEYLFCKACKISISTQPSGDPDSDDDGFGVAISDDIMHSMSYGTGISLMAISAAKAYAPGPVPTGPLTGWTYEELIQDMIDYLAFGQNDVGLARGGWGFNENDCWSDNYNTGMVTLGLGYAEYYGATIPQFVKDELNFWIDYIQNDVDGDPEDGGSGHTEPYVWINMLHTGNLLYQMAFLGYPADDERVIEAINYQERHWEDDNYNPGWMNYEGHPHYKPAYSIMKGFEAYSLETITVDGADIDWFDEMSTKIVESQNEDGSWPHGFDYQDNLLSTTYALLTLERMIETTKITVNVDIKPGSWPNLINKGSKGVFSAAICGTEEFDVMTIDPDTLKIYIAGIKEGVPPLRWSYEDVATPYTGEPGGGARARKY